MNSTNPLPHICGKTVLRQLSDGDLAHFQAYRTDPEVARFQSWDHMSDSEAKSFIQSMKDAAFLEPGHWYQMAIAEITSGHLIGDIGVCVDPEEKEAEVGFSLARNYQKKGLGREAVSEVLSLIFEHTRVSRIIGITDDRNLASVKLLKVVGLEEIRTLDTVFRGEPCTEITFAISRN